MCVSMYFHVLQSNSLVLNMSHAHTVVYQFCYRVHELLLCNNCFDTMHLKRPAKTILFFHCYSTLKTSIEWPNDIYLSSIQYIYAGDNIFTQKAKYLVDSVDFKREPPDYHKTLELYK